MSKQFPEFIGRVGSHDSLRVRCSYGIKSVTHQQIPLSLHAASVV